ncbi:MAG: hypothetical protein AAF253_12920 [Pseudomonadota bacterium]
MPTPSPFFLQNRDKVWPFFWPIFLIAIALFERRANALIAGGCLWLDYEISALGTLHITQIRYPNERPDWKDALFAATGAYGDMASRAPACAASSASATCPITLNIVYRRRTLRRTDATPALDPKSGLPLPHT